jgi:ABC-type branched-subunit amino acid transport system substrate-binding protein
VIAELRAGACLSLTGRFAPFGTQAAAGLRLWADEYGVALTIVDDASEPDVLRRQLPGLAADSDLLFGPYSTVLTQAAYPIAADAGRLLINHGGSGGTPPARQAVSIPTPAKRYAIPFIAHLASAPRAPLYTTTGRGTFGHEIIAGATNAASAAGLSVTTLDACHPPVRIWDLLSAGTYQDDIAAVTGARAMGNPPRFIGSVAAGVTSFGHDVDTPDGVFGIGQWAPGAHRLPDIGMNEAQLLATWRAAYDSEPDYPGVQAYTAGVISTAAAEAAGSTGADALWRALASMDVTTVFGQFRINTDGEQVGHDAVLTRWEDGRLDLI